MSSPPDVERLIRRINVIFGVVSVELAAAPSPDSRYSSAPSVRSFDIGIPDTRSEPSDPVEAARTWLNTPNPTFGGLCPKNYLEGDDDQRAFLDGVLASLEDGAFS